MAKRYYICEVIGTGTDNDPYRPSVANLGVAHSAVIKSDPQTGVPLLPWCLAIVSTADHNRVKADAKNKDLPEFPLDARLDAMQAATRANFFARVKQFGVPQSLLDGFDGYREVIRCLGRLLQPEFHEDRFDAPGN